MTQIRERLALLPAQATIGQPIQNAWITCSRACVQIALGSSATISDAHWVRSGLKKLRGRLAASPPW